MEIQAHSNELREDLKRKSYADKTIEIYVDWLKKLDDFFPKKKLDEIEFKDINEFLEHLQDRLNAAPATVNQAFQSYNYFFNKLHSKNFDLTKIRKPERKRSNPDILTVEEILLIIENTDNLQQKLLLATAYSAGLDISEVRDLKIGDVDFQRDIIKIRNKKGRVVREAILARYVKTLAKKHIRQNSPSTFLFESTTTHKRYNVTTIGRILKNQVLKHKIHKKISFKTLKYSYVMHSEQLGRPLQFILKDMKISSSQSLVFFNDIKNRNTKDRKFSPLDKISLHQQIEHPINRDYFEQIIIGISNKAERDYLKEALTCMSVGSLRAGIIFAWNAGILNIRQKCFNHGSTSLNNAIQKFYPRAKEIKKMDDFAYIKDSTLLLTAQELGEIDKGEKDSLEDCLDLRNKCGHPGNYKPKSLKASSFMEELINIVFR
ncbi:hypothetical protein BST97_03060 [Nonlabens spongiae]|uniref:Core-binding (CB) domain-containing protein n=1 Tax=Nonlabens spongiae TaxID=331648 RepID=A0A1W6MHJ6_9FLAO|nr:site-specific integrase [Nonlabens spongiae]ARN77062.1 hypothetical protein BST97_03060 [Nonlabens spongiae]